MSRQQLLISRNEQGRIQAADDLSEGGLLVGLSEMLFDSVKIGAQISITSKEDVLRLDALLFGESQGRVLVAVTTPHLSEVEKVSNKSGIPFHYLGQSDESGVLNLEVNNQKMMSIHVEELKTIWEKAIPLHMDAATS